MKIVFTTFLMMCLGVCNSQNNQNFNNKLFAELFSYLSKEKVTTDKIITLTVWSPDDKMSRELCKEFEKTNSIYYKAKLKGGSKGVLSVLYCSDKDEVRANIALNKEGIAESQFVVKVNANNKDFENILKNKSPGYNIVFDKDGKVHYENIPQGSVFQSFNKLVTR